MGNEFSVQLIDFICLNGNSSEIFGVLFIEGHCIILLWRIKFGDSRIRVMEDDLKMLLKKTADLSIACTESVYKATKTSICISPDNSTVTYCPVKLY